MFVVNNKNIFLIIGGLVVVAAVFCIVYFGLSLGIDFTGGSIMEVQFANRPAIEEVESDVAELGIESFSVRPTGGSGYVIRTPFLEENQRAQLMNNLRSTVGVATTTSTTAEATTTLATSTSGTGQTASVQRNRDELTQTQQAAGATNTLPTSTATTTSTSPAPESGVTQERFSAIGPTVGSQLATNAIWGIIAVIIAIVLFVTFAFRKVSEPVSSWVYGSTAIVALIHDILVPTAVFAILGYTMGAQVDLLFVMALLAILGFSVNDTIVVFDRIRENLREGYEGSEEDTFADTVGLSLEQTYARSINTSLTTLIVLAALYFLGGESTRLFSLTLLLGVIAGTYSSIFLASPLLVKVREWQRESA